MVNHDQAKPVAKFTGAEIDDSAWWRQFEVTKAKICAEMRKIKKDKAGLAADILRREEINRQGGGQ
jgi:hypothetical protein